MKFTPNKKYTTIAKYACAVCAVSVVCIALLFNLSSIGNVFKYIVSVTSPILIGFVIAYLINPLMKIFERLFAKAIEKKKEHPRLRRILSLIAVYLTYTLILTAVMMLVVPQIISSCNDLVGQINSYIRKLETLLSGMSRTFPFINSELILSLAEKVAENSSDLISRITPYLTNFLSSLAGYLKNIFLGLILSVYFLFSKEKLKSQFLRLINAVLPKKHSDSFIEFLQLSDNTFGGFITGKLLDSLIIGILTFIVLAIFRIPYSQLVAVIVGITNVIPFFGPFIGAIPSVFFIFIASPIKAVWFIIIIIIIQQLDGNVIGPKIIGQSTGLSSLGVIIAITVMGGLLGVPGMFIGVPLFALLYMMYQRFLGFISKKREAANSAGGSDERQ